MTQSYDLIIIGAGPCGLACAIAAQQAGLRCLVLEKGNLTESIRRYPIHMTFFSTSEMLEIGQVPFTSLDMRPSRTEALKYYRRVSRHFGLQVQPFTEVLEVQKREASFELHTSRGPFNTRFVAVATGYYDRPRFWESLERS